MPADNSNNINGAHPRETTSSGERSERITDPHPRPFSRKQEKGGHVEDNRISPEPPRRMRRYSVNVHRHLSELRTNMTPMERILWAELRNRKLHGIKFRRQHPIESFVLDSYAPELSLAIELDGDIHDLPERREADERRQSRLEAIGITIIRITNVEVAQNMDAVLDKIRAAIAAQRRRRPPFSREREKGRG